MRNTEELLQFENQIKSGDVAHCRSNGILGRAIRVFTRSHVNHTAMFIEIWGKIFVIESQSNGTNLKPFQEWVKKYNYKYEISRPLEFTAETKERAMQKIGTTGYDFRSLILVQPIYQVFGIWLGKGEKKADEKLYCSEFVGWVYKLENWWKNSPQQVYEIMSKSDFFNFV